MPRENRKRGKRHKKQPGEDYVAEVEDAEVENTNEQYSWIRPSTSTAAQEDFDAPFGFVPPDLKAYFRTVEEKLVEWQDVSFGHEFTEDLSEGSRSL